MMATLQQVDWADIQEGAKYGPVPMGPDESLRRATEEHGHRMRLHRDDPRMVSCTDCGAWCVAHTDGESGSGLIMRVSGTAHVDDCPYKGRD